jgi:hypothetical protein
MLDVAFCFVIVVFFALALAYVGALEKLRGGDHE